MDLIRQTKELCSKHNIYPSRSRGQNFLITENVYDKIIKAADLNKNDTVLEIGPGLGFLTEKLAEKAEKVIAVELDDKIVDILKKRIKEKKIKNIEIINGDVLKIIKFDNWKLFENCKLKIKNYKVVANLPYNITSVFLRKMLSLENKPKSMTLMLQKEVAERICARPPRMSLLAVSVQLYTQVEIMDYVGKENFWPEPKVDSAIIKLKVKSEKLKVNEKEFFRLVKIGFSAKRKMLKNNLSVGFKIPGSEVEKRLLKADFNKKIRPGELSVNQWIKLLENFNN
ncbi:ribosomal RNA small subunit methyltransferase A [Candidatus Falkowbacteria bacterium]|nr:MAG: ribosomal RNA small subunit methyltransferase A [Candidatus Falkowbacteria bacterium]